jgi:PadR family transcriptional regulator, regulatory protein PadR
MSTPSLDRELKKGSAELIILSIVETPPRHGCEMRNLIKQRSDGGMQFHVASLDPLLHRLEERGWLQGKWVRGGRRVLASQHDTWKAFVRTMELIAGPGHA